MAVAIMANNDITSAHVLLAGYVAEGKKGLPQSMYLDADSEREGRLALAKLLRNDKPIDRGLRFALAALFDPDISLKNEQNEDWPYAPTDRMLIFKFRSRRRRTNSVRNTAIVQRVHEIVKSKKHSVETAIASAADEFGISAESVKRLWQGYGWARRAKLFSDPK